MTTTTKAPEGRTEQLRVELRELGQQREQTERAIRLAQYRIEAAAARQQELVVAVVAEDQKAVEEDAGLEDVLQAQQRRQSLARSAIQQLDQQIEEAREDLAAEERRGHLKAFNRLGEERYALEEEAEAQMRALLNALEQLDHIDARQRGAGVKAGREDPHGEHPLRTTLYNWLCASFAGYLDVGVTPGTEDVPLYRLDGLSWKPPQR